MHTSKVNSRVLLSKRLSAAAFAVREGSRVADVGCDHGKLAASLVISGRCALAYALDISEPSLNKATDLFCALGITERAKALLSDGLSALDGKMTDDVIIAGLGCDTILKIIEEAPWLMDGGKRLILAPHSRHTELRRSLYFKGFEIIEEHAVFEAGHCYTVITAAYCGEKKSISPVFAALGKISPLEADAAAYFACVRQRYEAILCGMSLTGRNNRAKTDEAGEVLAYLRNNT